jgi:hypothetical protein
MCFYMYMCILVACVCTHMFPWRGVPTWFRMAAEHREAPRKTLHFHQSDIFSGNKINQFCDLRWWLR